MCDNNYNFFISHLEELCIEYEGQFIVIKDGIVLGSYDSFDEAFHETVKTEELGSFLIQYCSKDQGALVNNFYSNNVVFA